MWVRVCVRFSPHTLSLSLARAVCDCYMIQLLYPAVFIASCIFYLVVRDRSPRAVFARIFTLVFLRAYSYSRVFLPHIPPLNFNSRRPRSRRLREEHDHGCGADGRRHPSRVCARWADAAGGSFVIRHYPSVSSSV